jgi:predicted dehydrogenase
VKAALIGCGKAGADLLEELVGNNAITSIDIFDPRVHEMQNLNGLSSKIELRSSSSPKDFDYQLAVIASPDHTHFKYAKDFLQNDVHSFIEKPMVTNSQDLARLIKIVESRADIKLSNNFILRASPLFQRLRELISDGVLGPKLFIEGKYLYGRWSKLMNGWRGSSLDDYSVILGGLIHIVDLCCYLTETFDFDVQQERIRLTDLPPNHIRDFGQIRLMSEKIGVCSLTTTFSSPVNHRRDISIYGDLGWIEVIGESIQTGGSLAELGLEKLSTRSESKGTLLEEFIKKIQGQPTRPHLCPSALEVIKVHELLMEN